MCVSPIVKEENSVSEEQEKLTPNTEMTIVQLLTAPKMPYITVTDRQVLLTFPSIWIQMKKCRGFC